VRVRLKQHLTLHCKNVPRKQATAKFITQAAAHLFGSPIKLSANIDLVMLRRPYIKIRLFLLLCLLTFSQMAIADNGCVYGESPTGPRSEANPLGCVPDPRTLQQPQAKPEQPPAKPEQPPAPSGHWETRWGAIAIDGMKGKLAGVTNYRNKQEAADAALRQCYSRGGRARQ
jgi:hypothetical protein